MILHFCRMLLCRLFGHKWIVERERFEHCARCWDLRYNLRWKDSMKPNHAIQITSPHNGALVEYRTTVTGICDLPNTPVQVLIYSHDQKWYKQAPAVMNGSFWSLEAAFGFEESRGHYMIVAAAGPIELSPTTEIPDDVPRSKTVRVKRINRL